MWVPRKETVGNLWFPVGQQDRETAEPPRTDRKTLPPSADTETDPLPRLLCDPRWEKSILRSCWSSPLVPGQRLFFCQLERILTANARSEPALVWGRLFEVDSDKCRCDARFHGYTHSGSCAGPRLSEAITLADI